MNGIKNDIKSLNEFILLHSQDQTTKDWNIIEMKHGAYKNQHLMHLQPSTQINHDPLNRFGIIIL